MLKIYFYPKEKVARVFMRGKDEAIAHFMGENTTQIEGVMRVFNLVQTSAWKEKLLFPTGSGSNYMTTTAKIPNPLPLSNSLFSMS